MFTIAADAPTPAGAATVSVFQLGIGAVLAVAAAPAAPRRPSDVPPPAWASGGPTSCRERNKQYMDSARSR